jgi:hypothetical protein
MKEKFKEIKLNTKSQAMFENVDLIINEYLNQGYKLTLRQLYYQLVSRDFIPNDVKEYNKLGDLLTKCRMGGMIDWEAIEDRVRVPKRPYFNYDVADALTDSHKYYRRDRTENQSSNIEVWIEKDALSGVLSRVTNKYGVYLLVNRGYSSASSMYDSYKRFKTKLLSGKKCSILYLGDHDPSGKDMIRDIESRLYEFILNDDDFIQFFLEVCFVDGISTKGFTEEFNEILDKFGDDDSLFDVYNGSDDDPQFNFRKGILKEYFQIKPIALTWEQIQSYNPPPNPAKVDDPRAKEYIAKYGKSSWEVDALRPETLNAILVEAIESIIDIDAFDKCLIQEEKDKKEILSLINSRK